MAEKGFFRVEKALDMYGSLLVSKYKATLQADKTYASGKTSESIQAARSGTELTISFDKTLQYIDEGTKYKAGKENAPSPRNILAWMKVKGIRGRNLKTGRYIKDESFAFAISKHIQKHGTIKRYAYQGTSILSRVYNEIADKLGQDILDAWHMDVMDNLDDSLPNAKKT